MRSTEVIGAVRGSNIKRLRELLAAGADPNVTGNGEGLTTGITPLMIAANRGDVETVKLLIAAGADLNARDGARARSDADNWTPLHYAVKGKHSNVVFELIQAGAKIAPKTSAGYTPLFLAINEGDFESAKMLIEAGASLEKNQGKYPGVLTHAVVSPEYFHGGGKLVWGERNLEMVKYLVQKGADINGTNEAGQTALHFAANHNASAIANWLLKHGADVNTQEKATGSTPLFNALCHPKMVSLLISAGADVNALDNQGQTPLDEAESFFADTEEKRKANDEVVRLLLEAGAKHAAHLRPNARQQHELVSPPSPWYFDPTTTNPDFESKLKGLGQEFGSQPQPLIAAYKMEWTPVPGAYVVEGKRAEIERAVEKRHIDFLTEGTYIFVYADGRNKEKTNYQLGFLPTADKYEAILAVQPGGANYDIDAQDVVNELKKIESSQPFHLIGMGFDRVILRFLEPITDFTELAGALERFPAEAISPEDEDYLTTIEQIEQSLRRNPRITLVWER